MKRRFIGALIVCLVLASAGCQRGRSNDNDIATANGAKSTGPNGAAGAPADRQERARKFVECMKEQGVEVEVTTEGDGGGVTVGGGDPAGGGGSGSADDRSKVDTAMRACKQFSPDGGEPPKSDQSQAESMRAYAKCMRENGLTNFPDPEPGGGIRIESDSGVDPTSEEFRAAQQKCQPGLPAAPPGGGTSRVGG